jgi:hypothetical protein
MVNPASNVTTMLLDEAREPVAELVKPTVHVEVAWAAVEPGVKVTALVEAADATPCPKNGAAKPATTSAGRRRVRTRRTDSVVIDRA